NPEDLDSSRTPAASTLLFGKEELCARFNESKHVPYIQGLHPKARDGAGPTAVLQRLRDAIANGAEGWSDRTAAGQTHLVMRQQLFSNSSLSQVMFELTNALIELGFPTIPQD